MKLKPSTFFSITNTYRLIFTYTQNTHPHIQTKAYIYIHEHMQTETKDLDVKTQEEGCYLPRKEGSGKKKNKQQPY